ncbi:hypothetical protein DID88_003121 [Monilinia fructigena]|uniref:Uncharacterized protein n=1 Tax=Monilinia fructigena TaxID=38457 RepID=A0A395IWZ3_9HELO|nr:hypothetical protein DID88_003121 [Monilinia fructigena]
MAHKDKAYDFTKYQALVKDFCSEEWDDIELGVKNKKWGKKVDAKTAQEVCFKASWLMNVLHDGIGIPRGGLEKPGPSSNATRETALHSPGKGFLDPFQAVDKIGGVEVSWTLGKMILYASGQVPPATEDALPVGFGSNTLGVPKDFQLAGSNATPVPHDDDDWSDAADDLIEKAHSRSTPGFLLFMFLLVFLLYLFRKRDRRLRLYRGVSTALRRNRRPGSPKKGGRSFFGAGKLFGSRGSTSYERVLEGGEGAAEFELGDVDSEENENSDASEGSRAGRSSGLATPKLNVVNFETANYFDNNAQLGQGIGLGLGSGMPNAWSRSGLVVRTESRERLAPSLHSLGAGRRSRAGSPTRKSPLMTPFEES